MSNALRHHERREGAAHLHRALGPGHGQPRAGAGRVHQLVLHQACISRHDRSSSCGSTCTATRPSPSFATVFLAMNVSGIMIVRACCPRRRRACCPRRAWSTRSTCTRRTSYRSGVMSFVTNQFAAVPSLHIGYALFAVAGRLPAHARTAWRARWRLVYPVVVLAGHHRHRQPLPARRRGRRRSCSASPSSANFGVAPRGRARAIAVPTRARRRSTRGVSLKDSYTDGVRRAVVPLAGRS